MSGDGNKFSSEQEHVLCVDDGNACPGISEQAVFVKTLKKIVVVGRDAAAWLSVLVLNKALSGHDVKVELIELPSLLTESDVYISMPSLEGVHRLLGINEWEMLRKTKGIFSLGSMISNFNGANKEFFLPYGDHGTSIGGIPFFEHWMYAREQGLELPFDMFSLNARAAKELKFFKPDDETESLQICDYGYQLDAAGYINFLKLQALKCGIQTVKASGIRVKTDALKNSIISIEVDQKTTIFGDIFIDATGGDSLLLSGSLNVPFESWSNHFPFYRRISLKAKKINKLPAYSAVRSSSSGIAQLVALQNRATVTFAYNPIETSGSLAVQVAKSLADIEEVNEATYLDMRAGFRAPWKGNVVAIGRSAVSLDPILNTELHTIHIGIVSLIEQLQFKKPFSECVEIYNKNMRDASVSCRDFQLIKYGYNKIFDGSTWSKIANNSLTSGLQENMKNFLNGERLIVNSLSGYRENDWLAMFIGLEYKSKHLNVNIQKMDSQKIKIVFKGILEFIHSKVETMTPVDNYVENF